MHGLGRIRVSRSPRVFILKGLAVAIEDDISLVDVEGAVLARDDDRKGKGVVGARDPGHEAPVCAVTQRAYLIRPPVTHSEPVVAQHGTLPLWKVLPNMVGSPLGVGFEQYPPHEPMIAEDRVFRAWKAWANNLLH